MLRVCMLSYRSDPYCGGQGVYVKNLSRAIKSLGHHVDVIVGPPGLLFLNDDIPVYKIPCLDLYDSDNPFRTPTLRELFDPVNFLEWLCVSSMGFPEPFTFGLRINSFLKNRLNKYDIIHDNQSLSYGILNISKKIPTVATIHHPITKDRDIAIANVSSIFEKIKIKRWYSFIGMQKYVSKRLCKIITVSESSRNDLVNDFNISNNNITVVKNGIDTDAFCPVVGIKKDRWKIITVNGSGSPLKGFRYLLKAFSLLLLNYDVHLVVVGGINKNNEGVMELIYKLGVIDSIKFLGKIDHSSLIKEYSSSAVAVIPSIYEGFGFPALEAMACGVPVVSTTGGGLPEVLGDVGILVPPKDYVALSVAIAKVFENLKLSKKMSTNGIIRAKKYFTWHRVAEETVKVYKEVLS